MKRIDINPTIPMNTLNVNGLNISREEEDICILTADSLCLTAENSAILQSNYMPIKMHEEIVRVD